ncbi:DUF6378 domain-containing protein [Neorhizobium galegae]|uniref:DUF6378 domain-containing protein n=1 Tax=Neorhizobium galegae TaxID=399 RepID=UPI0006217645|nr:DUF6378 domain-containing protein [Neorhizobium galegae]CDZ55038.1 Hypothetical protein NGAL_HAMBI2427_59560 [Neorhizobium galegae bv. orientalis]
MKIEAGKSYRSRDGDKYVRPACNDYGQDVYLWALWGPDGRRRSFFEDGQYANGNGEEHGFDLVAEWQDIDEAREGGAYAKTPIAALSPADIAVAALVQAVTPVRVSILNEGAKLTDGGRDVEYGPPAINLACAGELKAVIRKYMRRDIAPGELEAIDQVCTKLGRVATGLQPKRDTYVDGATYFAIAGEIALASVDASVSEL